MASIQELLALFSMDPGKHAQANERPVDDNESRPVRNTQRDVLAQRAKHDATRDALRAAGRGRHTRFGKG